MGCVMDAKSWMRATDPADRLPVLAQAGTTYPYLLHLANGHRRPSIELAQRLAAASARHTPTARMTVAALRPDLLAALAPPAA